MLSEISQSQKKDIVYEVLRVVKITQYSGGFQGLRR
jgi:hypothetical protein